MKEINLVVSLLNYKKRDNKYKMVKKVTMIEKNVLEEQQIKLIDIIDALSKLVKDLMGLKDR